MKTQFFIFPYNEGQELNYYESYEGELSGAVKRGKEMLKQLKEAMKQGTISVEIQDKDFEKLKDVI